jgi:AraC-like DNA-binding protein
LAEGRQEFSADAEILSVRFEAIWPDGRPLFDRSRSIVVPEEEGRKLTRIGERLARIVERSASENLALEQTPHTLENFLEGERVFYGWLVAYCALMKERGQLPHVNRQLDERVWLAVSRLEARRLSEPVREQEIARVAGLSVTQLNRLFVSNLGKTPAEYWEDKRIRSARSALLISGRSIKSIAYDLGFSSLPHFSAWVKKRMGVSPRDFRKKGWSGLADNRG